MAESRIIAYSIKLEVLVNPNQIQEEKKMAPENLICMAMQAVIDSDPEPTKMGMIDAARAAGGVILTLTISPHEREFGEIRGDRKSVQFSFSAKLDGGRIVRGGTLIR